MTTTATAAMIHEVGAPFTLETVELNATGIYSAAAR